MKKVYDEVVRPFYEAGMNDSAIAKMVSCDPEAIRYWRKKNNLPSTFTYKQNRKHDFTEVDELISQNLSDLTISKITGISPMTIYFHRVNNDLQRKSLSKNEEIKLSSKQKELIIGCVMGDGSLSKTSSTSNTVFRCEHSLKQSEYNLWKCAELGSIGCKSITTTRRTPDKRNGNLYKSVTIYTASNPALNSLHEAFYQNGAKRIPFELFGDYSALSLAVHYMDDGTKLNNSYSICTQCFTREDVIQFQQFLLDKFGLFTSIKKTNEIYVLAGSSKLFKELVEPYIHETMKYKLH